MGGVAHLHVSPPCQSISKANGHRSADEAIRTVKGHVEEVRAALEACGRRSHVHARGLRLQILPGTSDSVTAEINLSHGGNSGRACRMLHLRGV